MFVANVIAELLSERKRLDGAINRLEKLVGATHTPTKIGSGQGIYVRSAAQRHAVSERMREYWNKRKAAP